MAVPSFPMWRILLVVSINFAALSFLAMADQGSGTATYYSGPYAPLACPELKGINSTNVAIAGDATWNGGSNCGKDYSVTCGGKTTNVVIIDYCGEGCSYAFMLSKEAYDSIEDFSTGGPGHSPPRAADLISITYTLNG